MTDLLEKQEHKISNMMLLTKFAQGIDPDATAEKLSPTMFRIRLSNCCDILTTWTKSKAVVVVTKKSHGFSKTLRSTSLDLEQGVVKDRTVRSYIKDIIRWASKFEKECQDNCII